MMITYLQHKDIDKKKWDNCIENAANRLIYAYSWYLDIVCPGWDALVDGDYEILMPLTKGKKYGIEYLYPPPFTQQLGIFSSGLINLEIIKSFLATASEYFKYIEMNLNSSNPITGNEPGLKPMINYELALNKEYIKIRKEYTKGLKYSINKAKKKQVTIKEDLNPLVLVDFIQSSTIVTFNRKTIAILSNLAHAISEKQAGYLFGAYIGNELCAAALIGNIANRAYYLVSASNDSGRKYGAMALLIDTFIYKNTNSNMIFDFEGSNIEGIASFFRSFGAEMTEYCQMKINNLPRIYKLFKK